MQMQPESLMAKVPKAMEVGGSVAAGTPFVTKYVFGMTPDEWSVLFGLCGFLVAVVGLVVNWYFKREQTKAYVAHLSAQDSLKPQE